MYAIKTNIESAQILMDSELLEESQLYSDHHCGSILTYAIRYAPDSIEQILRLPIFSESIFAVKEYVTGLIDSTSETMSSGRVLLNPLQIKGR